MQLAIIGNSGSGKSTLARRASQKFAAPCLDLDTVAWEPGEIAVAREAAAACADVTDFCAAHQSWVIEGCYASLIAAALPFRPRLIFLHPGVEQCLANCRARPWEPHKYASREKQDEHLNFLLDWVRAYDTRDDDTSLTAHRALFDGYSGPKRELRHLPDPETHPPNLLQWMRYEAYEEDK